MLKTPVAIVIFNRPDLTARVFAEIAKVKPTRLFVIAEGPRPGVERDPELCAAARRVVERVDWNCEVVRDYAETDMGAHRRFATGLTSAFQQVEELIVLEDDCIPHPTFFRYCEELLDRYRDDERVMHIAGSHLQAENRRHTPYSYSFANWNICWGWATWRRAWQHFDLEVRRWPQLRDTDFLDQLLKDPRAVNEYRRIFDELYNRPGDVDAWDHAWSFACWSQSGMSLLPSTALISNVGFGEDATHYKSRPDDPRGNLVGDAMPFPLKHPPCVVQDRAADDFIIQTYVVKPVPSFLGRCYLTARRILGAVVSIPVRRGWAHANSDTSRG
jgi:hypothetical protein